MYSLSPMMGTGQRESGNFLDMFNNLRTGRISHNLVINVSEGTGKNSELIIRVM